MAAQAVPNWATNEKHSALGYLLSLSKYVVLPGNHTGYSSVHGLLLAE